MSNVVSLEGLNKAAVFAALFNRAKAQGLGFLQYSPESLTAEQAGERFGECDGYYDYIDGRVMKVDLSGDELRTGLYNRDNGIDAAEIVIKALRDTGDITSVNSRHEHAENVKDSAVDMKEQICTTSHIENHDGIVTFTLGVPHDVIDDLDAALDVILEDEDDK